MGPDLYFPCRVARLPAEGRASLHAPAVARAVPLRCPWDALAFRSRARFGTANLTMVWKTWQRSARRGTRRFTRRGGAAARSNRDDGRSAPPDVHAAAEAQPWAGARRDSGSPVLAVLFLGERLEPPLDLSDPPLELLDLTTRRPELLHDRLGQALELPLERGQQPHPPGVQVLHRPLRALLDIHAQLPDVHQRENLVNHRPAAAFDQLARVVPQLADQPFPPPPQPPDRSTNIAQREQPCLCLFHEALLSAADHAVGQCPAARATKRQTKLADSSTRRTGTPWPAHRDDPKTVKN